MTPFDANTGSGLVQTAKGPLVLLFYDGLELKAAPGAVGRVYSQTRRLARYVVRNLKRTQVRTGFYVAFRGLQKCLEAVGADVRVNDFATAKRMPNYPIGLTGYPSVIDKVQLPNPAIFGPGDYGSPEASTRLRDQERFRFFIQPAQWYVDYFAPYSGKEKTVVWFVGIDVDAFPDMSKDPKTNDVLIYDKIRWFRDERVGTVLDRMTRLLESQGKSYKVLRYGHHHHSDFYATLRASKSMAFLCEHETQGLAYQEAMAANIPVFAWDDEVIVDPHMLKPAGLKGVSSVPYFDDRCGLRFKLNDMETAFDRFWAKLPTYRPRDYVSEALGLKTAGKAYLDLYARAMRPTSARV
jgi:hypothetical protein